MPSKLWEVMNDLQMVTSKICSAREILDSAIDAHGEYKYEKVEKLMYAVDEYLKYYLEEFDSKFELAWKETVGKEKEKELQAFNDVLAQSKVEKKTWTTPVEVDAASGEYFISIPDELIEIVGWEEGDTLEWIDNKDGTVRIRKVTSPLEQDEC